MKFDTKKCSPISLRSPTVFSPSRGLDDRDLVWRNSNKHIPEEHKYEDGDGNGSIERERDDSDNSCYGRQLEHLPRLVYTPVKVSARTKYGTSNSCGGGGGIGNSHETLFTRTVTNQEMDELNSCLMNLCFGGEHEHEKNEIENENGTSDTSAQGVDSKNNPLLGRISEEHVDSKTGKKTTIWKSTRVPKKIIRL